MEKLEGLRMNQEENHKNEWELRRRTEEIIELQNVLSESNIALNRERKKTINLSEEIEKHKMRSTEDRRRIVQLLQLAEPIEQTIKLYYDRRPEKLEKYAITDSQPYDPTSVALSKSVKSIGSGKRKNTPSSSAGKFNYRIPPSDEKQQIIRTVMFPNNNSSNGSNEEEVFLKKQIEELKNMYELQIMKMEEDRRMREEEFRLQNLNSKDKIEDLLRKNQKLEKLNYEITKDFMQLKYESSLNEKKLYEEMESLRTQGESLAQRLNEVTNKTKAEKESKKGEYERKASEIARVMRSQVKSQEENLNIMKEQYKQIQKVYNDKVKDLESKLKNLTEKCKNMENKRNYEIEGYINEIKLMRQRLKSYEDYVSKLRRMTEGGVDRYTQINEVTRTNNSEFLADTKKTKDDLDRFERRMRMYEDYDQNQETFNDNQMGDSIEDNMARSEMEVQSEQYEEPEMEI